VFSHSLESNFSIGLVGPSIPTLLINAFKFLNFLLILLKKSITCISSDASVSETKIQDITDGHIKTLNDMMENKEKELMEV